MLARKNILAFLYRECNERAPNPGSIYSFRFSACYKLRAMSDSLPADIMRPGLRSVIATEGRLLTFRASREELAALNGWHLLFGLLCTWVVGIGRYWDNSRVPLLQRLGVGSVIYIFLLSLLLWLVLWPLRPKNCSYLRVLTFVSLVSPPAILYAIPVEHFYSIDTANSLNLLFLAIVAAWRVALLLFFMRRLGEMTWPTITIAALLPLTLIVVTLTVLNLERVVFNVMGGMRPSDRSAADSSFDFLFLLSVLSMILFVPTLLTYGVLAFVSWKDHRIDRRLELERDEHRR